MHAQLSKLACSQAPHVQSLTNENSNVDGKVDGKSEIASLISSAADIIYARRASAWFQIRADNVLGPGSSASRALTS